LLFASFALVWLVIATSAAAMVTTTAEELCTVARGAERGADNIAP
jgi:hypothetical protein